MRILNVCLSFAAFISLTCNLFSISIVESTTIYHSKDQQNALNSMETPLFSNEETPNGNSAELMENFDENAEVYWTPDSVVKQLRFSSATFPLTDDNDQNNLDLSTVNSAESIDSLAMNKRPADDFPDQDNRRKLRRLKVKERMDWMERMEKARIDQHNTLLAQYQRAREAAASHRRSDDNVIIIPQAEYLHLPIILSFIMQDLKELHSDLAERSTSYSRAHMISTAIQNALRHNSVGGNSIAIWKQDYSTMRNLITNLCLDLEMLFDGYDEAQRKAHDLWIHHTGNYHHMDGGQLAPTRLFKLENGRVSLFE